jgi:hypothetical protein
VCVEIFYLVDQNGEKEILQISVGLELRILCARHNIREHLGTHAYKPQYVNCRRNGNQQQRCEMGKNREEQLISKGQDREVKRRQETSKPIAKLDRVEN